MTRAPALAALLMAPAASAQTEQATRALEQIANGNSNAQTILGSAVVLLVVALISVFALYVREARGRLEDAKAAKLESDAETKAARDDADRRATQYSEIAFKSADALVRSTDALKTNTDAMTRRGGA